MMRRSASSSTQRAAFRCLMLVSLAYLSQAGRVLLQATPDLSNLPQECISGCLGLQTSCGPEITAAQEAFGLTGANASNPAATANITDAQVRAYLANATKPSPACCASACSFNSQLCSCNSGVLSLVSSFTGNNQDLYASIAQAFAVTCNFTAYINTTCPANALTAPKPFGPACPAAAP